MKGLLDTHTFIWWDSDNSKLSPAALAFLKDPTSTLVLSVVSVWELVIKTKLGKLSLSAPLALLLAQQQANGLQILPVVLDHVLAVELLPKAHKDPFDRLLVAQAIIEKATLITADPLLSHYPVPTLW